MSDFLSEFFCGKEHNDLRNIDPQKPPVTNTNSDASVISDLEYFESVDSSDLFGADNFNDSFPSQEVNDVDVRRYEMSHGARFRRKSSSSSVYHRHPSSPSASVHQSVRGGNVRRTMSKNAILARENREKKKHYISSLEKSVCELTEQNTQLRSSCSSMKKNVVDLEHEVNYLRNVIVNQSVLAELLKNIPSCSTSVGVDLRERLKNNDKKAFNSVTVTEPKSSAVWTSSSCSEKNSLIDHDYSRLQSPIQEHGSASGAAGVCLHVASGKVTFELCSRCNESAQRTSNILC